MPLIRQILASRVTRWGFVVVAVGYGGYAISQRWADIDRALARIGLPVSLLALVFTLCALTASMWAWRVLLAGLGSPLPFGVAARIVFIGQLGKYLPGAVWPVLAQMELATEHDVPRLRTVTASTVNMLLGPITGLIVASAALPFTGGSTPYLWAFTVLPFLLACLHPRVLNYLIGRALRLARRPPLEQPLTGRVIASALGWLFASWACYGLQIWVLAVRVGVHPGIALPLSTGGFALAWSVGFLIIFLPAGAGAREVVLIAILGHPAGLTLAAAGAVALLSRAATLAADLITAGVSALFNQRGRARSKPAGTARWQETPHQVPLLLVTLQPPMVVEGGWDRNDS
jgi:glycosyltransferase 2 family protein